MRANYVEPGTLVLGIDCAPGTPRPDVYIQSLGNCFGINTENTHPVSQAFGAWSWEFSLQKEQFKAGIETCINTAEELYHSGKIRGAEHYWRSPLTDKFKESVMNTNTEDRMLRLLDYDDLIQELYAEMPEEVQETFGNNLENDNQALLSILLGNTKKDNEIS